MPSLWTLMLCATYSEANVSLSWQHPHMLAVDSEKSFRKGVSVDSSVFKLRDCKATWSISRENFKAAYLI